MGFAVAVVIFFCFMGHQEVIIHGTGVWDYEGCPWNDDPDYRPSFFYCSSLSEDGSIGDEYCEGDCQILAHATPESPEYCCGEYGYPFCATRYRKQTGELTWAGCLTDRKSEVKERHEDREFVSFFA